MPNWQAKSGLRLGFQTMDQYEGGEWFIQGTNTASTNSWKARYPGWKLKIYTNEVHGNRFNVIFAMKAQEQKHQRDISISRTTTNT